MHLNRYLQALLLLCIFTNRSFATTPITTANVSGHWTLAGSPYNIYNDISVIEGDVLTIDPGVEVIFQGPYRFFVYGALYSAGTAAQPISYHVQDTTGWALPDSSGGWRGIFLAPATDSCSFSYCNVYDMKAVPNPSLVMTTFAMSGKAPAIQYCNFFHNNGYVINCSMLSSQHAEISHCNIHDNISLSPYDGKIISVDSGTIYMHDCNVYNNTSAVDLMMFYAANTLFINNTVYQNTEVDSTIASTVSMQYGQAVIYKNNIHHNQSVYDGPVQCYSVNADINSNLICNNTNYGVDYGGILCSSVQGGGGIRVSSEMDTTGQYVYTIRNNVVANNYTAFYGGGIYVFQANTNIFNNHIINNSATEGGGIYAVGLSSDHPTAVNIKNNLFFNNAYTYGGLSFQNYYLLSLDTVRISNNWSQRSLDDDKAAWFVAQPFYSRNVMGVYPGITASTISYSPTEDATGIDFSLLATSGCIDSGTSLGVLPDSADYAGHQRLFGSAIDIGAYEWNPWNAPLNVEQNTTTLSVSVFPNPAINVAMVVTDRPTGTLNIIDQKGAVVSTTPVSGTTTSLNVQHLARGVYTIRWEDGNTVSASKLVLQ